MRTIPAVSTHPQQGCKMSRPLKIHDPIYQDSPANAEFSAPNWAQRIKGGLTRRVQRQLRVWRGQTQAPAEQAVAALHCCHWQQPATLPSADDVEAALRLGQMTPAKHLVQVLLNAVEPGRRGAIVDGVGNSSPLQTGEALRAWLAWLNASAAAEQAHRTDSLGRAMSRDVERAIARSAAWLSARITPEGELQLPPSAGSLDRFVPRSQHLRWASTLRNVGDQFGESAWKLAADRAIARLRRQTDFRRWQAPLHLMTPGWLALIELGETSLASEALRLPESLQRKAGAVPALPEARWVSLPGLAQLARAWILLGDHDRGHRALAWCGRQQRAGGSFPGSAGPGACFHADESFTPSAIQYLLATHAQVVAAFAGEGDDFPAEIDEADGRWQTVLAWARELPRGARVADIGCGRGRYLRRLQQALPHLQLTGIDVCERHLEALPRGIERRAGQLLRLPAAPGEFAAVFSVEACEHALVPRVALDEICRVARPGGSVLVIDKNRQQQALSEHAPWERWLDIDETRDWLGAACDRVSATLIAHGKHAGPTGLFVAWTGVRKLAAARAA